MKRSLCSLVVVALCACSGTEGKRRTLPLEVLGSPPTTANDKGWALELSAATVHVGSIRFFEGEAPLGWRFSPYALIGGTAWAHPGHYEPGQALGEWLVGGDADLLSRAPTSLGDAEAVTGDYGSMQLGLSAPGVRVVGIAVKEQRRVPFELQFAPPAALEGVRFEHAIGTQAGAVRVTVKLQSVLSRIDFGAAAEVIANAFSRGVEDTGSYAVTWEQQ